MDSNFQSGGGTTFPFPLLITSAIIIIVVDVAAASALLFFLPAILPTPPDGPPPAIQLPHGVSIRPADFPLKNC